MLKQINIKNFAIIDQMSIDFNEGLTVITGQTGAGKSIVIDAIEQLLGARASQTMVSHNHNFAYIEGVFEYNLDIETILKNNNITLEDDYLIISKKIKSDGKSQLRINNRIATNDLIRQVGFHLVEIHSQHATYLLNEQTNQQDFIDSMFNKNEKDIYSKYQKLYSEYHTLLIEKENLLTTKIDPELLVFYQDQLKEINDNNLAEEKVEELQNQEKYYKEFEKISKHIESSLTLINRNNLVETLNRINTEVNKLNEVNDNYASLSSKIEEIYYGLVDFDNILKSEYDELSFDQNEYELIKEILFNYQKMIKKYSYSKEEVDDKIIELDEKINFILNSDGLINELDKKIEKSKIELEDLSMKLDDFRLKHSTKIEKEIKNHLESLYLKDALFKIQLDSTNLTKYGQSKINFLFSANKGSSLKLMNQVASGGELSRLMLALKIVSINDNGSKTYIFDEIDTGVSGEVADAIGSKIKEISLKNDVICISHLPQVAVYANNHLYIEKNTKKQFTSSNCYYLNNEEQVAEIAKMLSGDSISNTALEHARELISNVRT